MAYSWTNIDKHGLMGTRLMESDRINNPLNLFQMLSVNKKWTFLIKADEEHYKTVNQSN